MSDGHRNDIELGGRPVRTGAAAASGGDPFGGVDEQAFLARIRERMRRRPAPAPPEPYAPGAGPGADREESFGFEEKFARFRAALEALGGKVYRARGADAAFSLVASELAGRGAQRVVTAGGDWSACAEALRRRGIALDCWDELTFAFGSPERSPDFVNRWDAGINWADFAVAELGSLAVLASEAQGRAVSLLPPLYVALVRAERLVYSRRTVLAHVAKAARAGGRPPALTFITGPSRSADIEMDLSVGVHGPGEVIAVVVEESPAG